MSSGTNVRLCLLLAPVLLAAPVCAQSPQAEVEGALERGQAWLASQRATALLAKPEQRTPELVLLAARAAAAWEGWDQVRTLLANDSWLDTRFDRLGRRLQAEAALATNRNDDALVAARAAVLGDPRDNGEQGRRLVLLARAFDRLDRRDSAALAYRAAAGHLPEVSDWLMLRAAGVTDDSVARARLLAGVTLAPAAARVPWTEAQALERTRQFAQAASAYARLGATAASLRLRWQSAASQADRRAVTAALLAQLEPGVSTTASRDALIIIERTPIPLTAAQQLVVARRAAQVGRAAQAADAFAFAAKVDPLSPRDRFTYGNALSDLGRWPQASVQFRGVTDPALMGRAAYFHARALLRAGQNAQAVNALQRVVTQHPRDTVAAGTALYLLGDLALDAGDVTAARRWFAQLGNRYPTSSTAPRAALTAGLIAFARGEHAAAAVELAHAASRYTQGTEGDAIRYWLARSRHATGNRAAGDSLLRVLVARGPESYYAARAAARLDTIPWIRADLQAASPVEYPGIRRAALLESLGMETEARFELDHVAAIASGADAMLETAEAFSRAGYHARASQLATRALGAGARRDERVFRLLYPMPWPDALRAAGERESVDPYLAASLIRQESAFQPHATSGPGARGLMQIMPAVGKELGRAFGFPDLDPALLWQPEVNIPLGMRHFGASLRRYAEPERALAAYNAGQSRVNRWSTTPLSGRAVASATAPVDDIELFVERIPFVETRDYVRVVLRNWQVYRMLYGNASRPDAT